jgi:hypothetical protein
VQWFAALDHITMVGKLRTSSFSPQDLPLETAFARPRPQRSPCMRENDLLPVFFDECGPVGAAFSQQKAKSG